MKKRMIAAVLLVLMILSLFAACTTDTGNPSGTENGGKDTGNSTAKPSDTKEGYDKNGYILDRLPQTIDQKNEELSVLYWSDRQYQEFDAEGQTGESVNDAIFWRNSRVEKRLNDDVTFKGIKGDGNNYTSFVQHIETDRDTGKSYDIIAGYSIANASLASKGICTDLMEYDSILEFDMPWWPQKMVDESTLNGKLFFVTGDISTNLLMMMQCVYFNKNMVNERDDLDSPYNLVINNRWTIGMMIEMAEKVYEDGGSPGKDADDTFGFTVSSETNAFDTLFYSCGLRTMEKDDSDLPAVSEKWNSEKTGSLLQKINRFFNTNNAYKTPTNKIFKSERALFEMASLNLTFLTFSDIDFYGIVPAPMFDEYQEEGYLTAVSTPHTLYSITDYSQKKEHGAYWLECMASESYRTVTPIVFTKTLKSTYSTDQESSRMLDIIRGSIVFDVGRIYSYAFDNLTLTVWRDCIKNDNSNFSAEFKRTAEGIVDKRLTELREKFS